MTLEAPFVPLLAPLSGYIRFVDTQQLLAVAKTARLQVQVLRRVGHFVPAGVPLLVASGADRLNEETRTALLATFDIGPARTLQQDVKFGVLQTVDIALCAMSPAVNDPSTAITCLDQIGRVLIRWIGRDTPRKCCSIGRMCCAWSCPGSTSMSCSTRPSNRSATMPRATCRDDPRPVHPRASRRLCGPGIRGLPQPVRRGRVRSAQGARRNPPRDRTGHRLTESYFGRRRYIAADGLVGRAVNLPSAYDVGSGRDD